METKVQLAVICIVKNEAASLLEWLAWHRVQGVSHFVIIDNYSTDDTWPMLQRLARTGWLSCYRIPTLDTRPPQMHAYRRALPLAARRAQAVAIIDADEYLMPTVDKTILDLCTEWFADKNVGAVALNWACFGSADNIFASDGFVFERFCQRFAASRLHNLHYKTLFRPDCVARLLSPHQVQLSAGHYVNSVGAPLVDHAKHRKGLSEQLEWGNARVNHYVVKSLEEFLVRKSAAGSAASITKKKHQTYFEKHNFNDEVDNSALKYLPEVGAEYARLQQLNVPAADSNSHVLARLARAAKLRILDGLWLLRMKVGN